MPVEVILPKVDMDMETGVIVEWKVADGARVRQGDILFDIETNKSVMEVESPGSGIIRGLAPITGEPIAVGTPVAWIYFDDEAAAKLGSSSSASDPSRAEAAHSAADAATTPAATVPLPSTAGTSTLPDAVRATPLARKLARDLNVDLATISGSGPSGRIVAKDVSAGAAIRQRAPLAPPSAADESGEGRLVSFNPVRRIVAHRLGESMRTVPHFYLCAQIEMTALRDTQKRIAPDVERAAGVKASMTVLLAYIAGRVLIEHPMLNASIEGDAARLHPSANIGIAMDRNGDLIVPVLRDVQRRDLADLARELAQLRDAARRGDIVPAQMRGGTFTLSNLGMYGVDSFTAIINPPEAAILAIGRTVETPVGRDGQIVLRPMATFSLSSDHRIVDGVTAARFMADLRKAIESPDILV